MNGRRSPDRTDATRRVDARRVTRRGAVAAGVAGLAGLAGCAGGRSAPRSDDVELETLAAGGSPGGPITARPAGRVVLLDFFATWCPSCETQMSNFRTLAERYPDLHLLSITWEDDRSAVRAFWTRHGGTWPVATDPRLETGQAFGVDTIPTMLVFDPAGTEVWRDTGLASVASMADAVETASR